MSTDLKKGKEEVFKEPKEKNPGDYPAAWKRFMATQRWAGGADIPLPMRLGRTSHLLGSALEQALGFNSSQIRILLGAMEPEGVIQASLSKFARVDPAAITRSIQAMERDGLIRREPDPKDNRCTRIFATEKGRSLGQALPQKIADFEASVTAGLTDEEILGVHKLLLHVEERLLTGNAGISKREKEDNR